jgi:hypothetical protein
VPNGGPQLAVGELVAHQPPRHDVLGEGALEVGYRAGEQQLGVGGLLQKLGRNRRRRFHVEELIASRCNPHQG